MSVTINGTNGLVFNDASTQNTAATGFGFKNRIINGAMMISQRNGTSSVTANDGVYGVDRFVTFASQSSKLTVQQDAGAVTPPAGFSDYLGYTSSSAYSITSTDFFGFVQHIEGFNTADFAWGTASATPVTLSFWVRSSLTGTFGGSITNSAQNRCYPFTYTISAANTWEQKSITIAGDTSGTWLTTNGRGLSMYFSLGIGSTYSGTAGAWSGSTFYSATGATSVVGTNGATFYITGVQLEKGSTATSFDYRPYGTELALCQRYYFRWTNSSGASIPMSTFAAYSSSAAWGKICDLPVPMRTVPTGSLSAIGSFNPTNSSGSNVTAFSGGSLDGCTINTLGTTGWTGSSGLTGGNASVVNMAANAWVAGSAEL